MSNKLLYFFTPHLSEGRKCDKNLVEWDKDRERSHHHHGQNRLHSNKLIYFIANQMTAGWRKINPNLKTPSPHPPSLLPKLSFTPDFLYTLARWWCRWKGNGGCNQSTRCLCCVSSSHSSPAPVWVSCRVTSLIRKPAPSLTPLPSCPQVLPEACSCWFPTGSRFPLSNCKWCCADFFLLSEILYPRLSITITDGHGLGQQQVHPGATWHCSCQKCRNLLAASQRNHPWWPPATKTWPLRPNTYSLHIIILAYVTDFW